MKVLFGLFLSIFSLQVVAAVSDHEIEDFLSLPTGTLDSISTNDATEGSALKGSFDVMVGDTFSFDFVWNSYEMSNEQNYNDFAFFSLSLDGVDVLADTSTPDNYTDSFSWTADESGQLDFGIGIMDDGDWVVDSLLHVSNLSSSYGPITGIGNFLSLGDGSFRLDTTGVVPLPAPVWLFLTGIAFIMVKGKNRSISRA